MSGNELDINAWGWVFVDFGNYALEIIGDGWETGLEYFGEFMRGFGALKLTTDNTDFSATADLSAGKGGASANSNIGSGISGISGISRTPTPTKTTRTHPHTHEGVGESTPWIPGDFREKGGI